MRTLDKLTVNHFVTTVTAPRTTRGERETGRNVAPGGKRMAQVDTPQGTQRQIGMEVVGECPGV